MEESQLLIKKRVDCWKEAGRRKSRRKNSASCAETKKAGVIDRWNFDVLSSRIRNPKRKRLLAETGKRKQNCWTAESSAMIRSRSREVLGCRYCNQCQMP
jgi:hypothetical protein